MPPAAIEFRLHGRVCLAATSLDHAGGGENLRTVAIAAIGLLASQRPYDGEHTLVEPQVFWRRPPGNHQRVVVGWVDVGEVKVEPEIVARLFGVGLMPSKS